MSSLSSVLEGKGLLGGEAHWLGGSLHVDGIGLLSQVEGGSWHLSAATAGAAHLVGVEISRVK